MSNNNRSLTRAQLLKQTKVIRIEYAPNADVVLGTSKNETLVGGNGDDILDGKQGNDIYRGNGGSDTFVIGKGQGTDRILDFQNGVDMIGLAHGLLFEDLTLVQRGDDTLLVVDGKNLGIVDNIQVNQLTAADFISVPSNQFEGLNFPIAAQNMLDSFD